MKKNNTNYGSALNKILCFILLTGCILNIFCVMLFTKSVLSTKLIITGIILLIWAGGIYSLFFSHRINLLNICTQVFVISFICSAFVVSAYLSDYTSLTFSGRVSFIWSFFLSITCISFIGIIKKVSLENFNFKQLFKLNYMIIITIAISVILRLFMLNTLQRWDAGEYYYALGNACSHFKFSPRYIFDNFRLCNHTTLGFSFIMSIGEFLNPRGITGVLIINLILTIAAVICIYRILTESIPIISNSLAGIVSLIFSLTPFFLGSFGYITPDYLTLIAFIFVIYCELRKKYICELFWILIMLNTKESAILILFGYFLFKLIYDLCNKSENIKEKFKRILKFPSYWMAVTGVLLYLLIIILQGGLLWKGGTRDNGGLYFSNSDINSVGISIKYIFFRIKQHFILNFAWIFSILNIISLLKYIFDRKRLKKPESGMGRLFCSVSGGLLFAFFSNAFFITAGAYRYCTVFFSLYGIYSLTIFCVLYEHKSVKKYEYGLIMLLAILLGVNSYIHIDPVSRIVFPNRSTGAWYTLLTNYTHKNYGNDLCNNYQYTWLDDALDEMMKDVDFNEKTAILLLDGQHQGSQIKGNGSYYRVCWDKQLKKRVIYDKNKLKSNANLVKIEIYTKISDALDNAQKYDKLIAIQIPYYDIDFSRQDKDIQEFFTMESTDYAGDFRGKIKYYILSPS